ncbi:hypothetical protein DTO027B5_4593 [Paecilomyces variotii]|nr:hypothetical protein DTO169C6_5803 [Paecilomyces variotii]KAJ9288482.1 hypothetical protein DTO021C3_4001 [Paecilomyces variotii]KAJ9304207.1 hypothetical protein DTO217A2_6290 [Paecilomyces variotii]KAJ9320150.1 hypothetical protein DTO027B3_8832 [Paecilomyces variotii]KAJ9333606.1 hypothetical protein DTO027B5_4593 [Paecilomyces variotii]
MAAVNRNMFDASVSADPPHARGATVMILPLNLIAQIISHLDNPADLARVCRTCRVLNYMALPQLYRNLTLTSYDKIRYRDEQPEGWGGSSPFSMGLNAVVTRPHAELVRSMTLRGEWRELELQEHARVGRVPDSSMMLNIAVRAAIDRMAELESFSWEMNTKLLETVYQGLAQRPKLTSLTIRFPSSRHPRPTTVIPPMPHLRSLKVTDIDPLCYPDDLSTLLLRSRKLEELKMHWSPRMREAQEPSVMLHDYFRKCIAAKSPLKVKRLALQNLYALHTEEFRTAFDQNAVEEITVLNSPGVDIHTNSFVDNSWTSRPPDENFRIKSLRHDHISRNDCEFLAKCSGLERLYFVNAIRGPSDYINTPRPSAGSASAMTPPTLENAPSSLNGATGTAAGSTDSPHPQSPPNPQHLVRHLYLNNVTTYHGSTLRHLLLSSRWPLSSNAIARVVRSCPNLSQLAFAPESSSLDVLAILIPFLQNLLALRLLIPTDAPPRSTAGGLPGHAPSNGSSNSKRSAPFQTLADIVELDDAAHIEMMSSVFTDQETNGKLKVIGIGWKAFELGGFYTVPAASVQDVSGLYPASVSGAASLGQQRIIPVDSPCQPGISPTSATRPDREAVTVPSTATPFPDSPVTRSANSTVPSPKSSLGKHPRSADSLSLLPDQKRPSVHDSAISCGNPISSSVIGPDGQKLIWRRRVRRVGWEVLRHWEIWSLDVQEM